jgi:hypothetical protein
MSPCYNVKQALILLVAAVLISQAALWCSPALSLSPLVLDVMFLLFRAPLWPSSALSLVLDVLFRAPPLPSPALSLVFDVLSHAPPLPFPALVHMLFLAPTLPSNTPGALNAVHAGALNAFHSFHALFFLTLRL